VIPFLHIFQLKFSVYFSYFSCVQPACSWIRSHLIYYLPKKVWLRIVLIEMRLSTWINKHILHTSCICMNINVCVITHPILWFYILPNILVWHSIAYTRVFIVIHSHCHSLQILWALGIPQCIVHSLFGSVSWVPVDALSDGRHM